MDLSLSDVKEEDRGAVAPCGIICAGCDWHIGESAKAAESIIEIWEGHNLADVAILKGMHSEDILTTIKALKQYVDTGSCPGCFKKEVGYTCPVGRCVMEKGYWTCAECADYDPEATHPCPHTDTDSFPNLASQSRSDVYDITCKRYASTVTGNLKRCREIGYPAFIEEARGRIGNGWRTWQVISNEMVVTGRS